jgi:hypothetical protein
VAPRSTGSGKGDVFFGAKWQFVANALYQLPYGFELAGAVYGRDGFPRPIIINLGAGQDGTLRALAVPELDTQKFPNIWTFDFRLAKRFTVGPRSLVLSAEVFNAFNSNTMLNQNRDAGSSVFDRVDEILAPRIARFGLTLNF